MMARKTTSGSRARTIFFAMASGWLASLLSSLSDPAYGDGTRPSAVLAEVDIPSDGDALLVPVTIDGEQYLFMVDSGATRVTFDERFRHALGDVQESVVTTTTNGPARRELFNAPHARIAGLPLRAGEPPWSALVACTDLSHLRQISGQEIYGVIGMYFLRDHAIQLDFDRGKLSFLRAVPKDPGIRVPIIFDKGMPHLYARLAGYGASLFLLDTGQFGTNGSIRSDVVNELLKTDQAQRLPPTKWRFLFRGTWEMRPFRLSSFKLGDFEHHGLIFEEHSRDFPNVLGLGFLTRYLVTIDFPNQAIYFKRGKEFARRECGLHDGCERLGLGLMREGTETVVTLVEPRKPAELAGLHLWDVVLTVNGRDVSDARLIQVYSLLNEAKGDVTFTVRRGSRTMELKARTRETMNGLGNTAHSTEQSRATRSKREGATAGKKEATATIQKDRSN